MWPPTDHNLTIYGKCFPSPALWEEEERNLEHGCYVVTTEDLAFYLPAGWLHGTITLRGGGTTGIEFNSAGDLELATRVWDIESSKSEKEPADNWPFIYAIVSALDYEDTQERALTFLCERNSKPALDASQKKELTDRLGTLGKECGNCRRTGKDHALAGTSTQRSTHKRRKIRR